MGRSGQCRAGNLQGALFCPQDCTDPQRLAPKHCRWGQKVEHLYIDQHLFPPLFLLDTLVIMTFYVSSMYMSLVMRPPQCRGLRHTLTKYRPFPVVP